MSSIIKRLENPLRRRILELLKNHKAMRASDLKRELKVATGTFYYHIDVLGDLVKRDGRLFRLSKKGLKALAMASPLAVSELKVTSIFHKRRVYTLFSLFGFLVTITYFYLSIEGNLIPFLCIALTEKRASLENMLLQLFVLVVLTYGLSFTFTRRVTMDYLLAFPYLLFSLIVYPFYILFLRQISRFLLVIPMSVFVILNSLFISKTIGMKIEKSLTINLIVAYIALFCSLFS